MKNIYPYLDVTCVLDKQSKVLEKYTALY